ncbi:MAG: F0F1 ATP synthase subunit B [Rhodospirillales bacterium]|nr:F0F1 ATP synthase subunit B [Rhodospirillales bacterium]
MLSSPEFWVAVAFVIFVGLAYRPLARMIVGALDERSARIRADLEKATQLREEAQNLLAQYQRKHREAMKEAADIVAHAKAEAERLAVQGQKELDDALKRREQLALQHIAQAEAQAVQEVRARAVDAAVSATAKLIAERMDSARQAALIEQAIRELPAKLN